VTLRVLFAPEVEAQLRALYRYIAKEASAEISEGYVDAIVDKCLGLAEVPNRGTSREDVRPGLRTIPFRRRVTIAYSVDDEQVLILGIFYAGQDFTVWPGES
jgi:toxin ParE1/3/4